MVSVVLREWVKEHEMDYKPVVLCHSQGVVGVECLPCLPSSSEGMGSTTLCYGLRHGPRRGCAMDSATNRAMNFCAVIVAYLLRIGCGVPHVPWLGCATPLRHRAVAPRRLYAAKGSTQRSSRCPSERKGCVCVCVCVCVCYFVPVPLHHYTIGWV